MARRRKRSKAAAASKARDKEDGSPMMTEKSLPALPPEIAPIDQGDADSDAGSTSPRPQTAAPRINNNNSRIAPIPARSPERPSTDNGNAPNKDTLTLPSSTYRKNRNSAILPSGYGANQKDPSDGFYISVALDPTPNGSAKASLEANTDAPRNSKTTTERRTELAASPHIAFQEKGRQQSADHILQAMAPSRQLSKSDKERSKSSKTSPDTDDARKPEAPRSKRLQTSRTNSSQSTDLKQVNAASRPRASQDARLPDDEATTPTQELNSKTSKSAPGISIARKELPASANRTCELS